MGKVHFRKHRAQRGTSIAKVVLMPGDPLRAKLALPKYSRTGLQQRAAVMLGYTGTYNDNRESR